MNAAAGEFFETIQIRGHIIDSLLLPKVLDAITTAGGQFSIEDVSIGQTRHDPSSAVIRVTTPTEQQLAEILAAISDHGAVPIADHDCELMASELGGTFPEGFYSSTNQRTEIRVDGEWIPVGSQEMDCGIAVDPQAKEATCVPMTEAAQGQQFVIGHLGVRVHPEARGSERAGFEFMNSAVSTEKPKGVATSQIAEALREVRAKGKKVLVVGGPAIVHTGSGEYLSALIRANYVHKLFAGNALAAHDIEHNMFGTSLGVHLESGDIVEAGHEHHLRAINRVRRLGSIRAAVEQGALTGGIMYECVQHGVDYLLAGSIRDDGPLPEVVTDVLQAQREMRGRLEDVEFCLMIATTLHSIAVGNLLPAWVRVVCVDINPSTVIKLSDRGSFQTVGLVTDVQPFLRALVEELEVPAP